ncbi:MFS transporter, partial [Staphylococcus cohnii]|uniref:MFS transporter n=1 Tax=Staphylococcus cohnii TaxID=29382 RepID=UPI000D4CE075
TVLSNLRHNQNIDVELREIQDTIAKEQKTQVNNTLATLFTGKYKYLVVAGLGVAAFQQFQGANAIFYYIPLIVEQATGNSASNALMWPIIQGVILVLGSLLFIAIADKFNRRTLLMLGGTVMGLSFILPAVIHMIAPNTNLILIVVFLSIYV